MQVVIVEDDEMQRDLFSVLALAAGSVVATFADAPTAQAWDGWPTADVLIADYHLGGPTGAELVAWVRANHPDVYTILTSAVNPAEDSRRVAHLYLDKLDIGLQLTDLLGALRGTR